MFNEDFGVTTVYVVTVGNVPLCRMPENTQPVFSQELIHLEMLSGSRQESSLGYYLPWEEDEIDEDNPPSLDDFYIAFLKNGYKGYDLTKPHRLTIYRDCGHPLVDGSIPAAVFEFHGI